MKRRKFLLKTAAALLVAPYEVSASTEDDALPNCGGNRDIAGWTVTWGGIVPTFITPNEISWSYERKKGLKYHFAFMEDLEGNLIYLLEASLNEKKSKILEGVEIKLVVDGESIYTQSDLRRTKDFAGLYKALSAGNTCEVSTMSAPFVSAKFSLKGFNKALDVVHSELLMAEQKKKNKECKDCFITTAACDTVGLSDDCFELQQLRRFRDRYMTTEANRAQDIDDYYALAPMISKQLSDADYMKLYWVYILPCSLMAYLRFDRFTYISYKRMFVKLMSKVNS